MDENKVSSLSEQVETLTQHQKKLEVELEELEAAYQRKRRKVQKDGQHFLKEMKRVRFMNNQHASNHFSIQSTWKCSTNVLHSLLVCLCFSMSYPRVQSCHGFAAALLFCAKVLLDCTRVYWIPYHKHSKASLCAMCCLLWHCTVVSKCKLLPCLCSCERPH